MMQSHDAADLRHGSKIQLSTRYKEWERGKNTRDEQEKRERRQRTGAIGRKMLKKLVPSVRFLIPL